MLLTLARMPLVDSRLLSSRLIRGIELHPRYYSQSNFSLKRCKPLTFSPGFNRSVFLPVRCSVEHFFCALKSLVDELVDFMNTERSS